MPDDLIRVDSRGPVATLVFNNPERRNAVSLAMWLAVTEHLRELAAAPDVRVLVVRGAGGKAFVSGADISKFDDERSSREAVGHYNEAGPAAWAALEAFPRPPVAKINGAC